MSDVGDEEDVIDAKEEDFEAEEKAKSLLDWVNHHLERQNYGKRVSNFGEDFTDPVQCSLRS